jgi:hypothetical protein
MESGHLLLVLASEAVKDAGSEWQSELDLAQAWGNV